VSVRDGLDVDLVARLPELRDELSREGPHGNVRLAVVPDSTVVTADVVDPKERLERLRARRAVFGRRRRVLALSHRSTVADWQI